MHDDHPDGADGAPLDLNPRTGEFRSSSTERRYRREVLEQDGARLARIGRWVAAIVLSFTLVDLSSLGAGRTWLVLLVARSMAAGVVVAVASAARRDAGRFVDRPWSLVLNLGELAVTSAILLVAALRPADAVTHAVSVVIAALVVAIFVPGTARSRMLVVLTFFASFIVVAHLRFAEQVSMTALSANLAAAALFACVMVTTTNRSRRIEWSAHLHQHQANEQLRDEVLEGERLRAELNRQATQDPLTGLANRRYFFGHGDELVEFGRRHQRPIVAVLMDLDGFKSVNDLHGHAAGDALLKAIGDALRAGTRAGELVGRIGGEEFAVVAEAGSGGDAEDLAERLRAAVAAVRVTADGAVLAVTVSVGFTWVGVGESLASALGRADRAMYDAKRAGGDRVLCGAA